MRPGKKQLNLLSEAEQAALYDLPDLNTEQRLEFFALSDNELQIVLNRQHLSAQVYCILQFGYFKAVKMFFRVSWDNLVPLVFR